MSKLHIIKNMLINQYIFCNSRCGLTYYTFEALASFSKLKILKLNYNLDVCDMWLVQIERCKNLKELHIHDCGAVTPDCVIRFIERCPNIQVIDFINIVQRSAEMYWLISSISKVIETQNREQPLQILLTTSDLDFYKYKKRYFHSEITPWINCIECNDDPRMDYDINDSEGSDFNGENSVNKNNFRER